MIQCIWEQKKNKQSNKMISRNIIHNYISSYVVIVCYVVGIVGELIDLWISIVYFVFVLWNKSHCIIIIIVVFVVFVFLFLILVSLFLQLFDFKLERGEIDFARRIVCGLNKVGHPSNQELYVYWIWQDVHRIVYILMVVSPSVECLLCSFVE